MPPIKNLTFLQQQRRHCKPQCQHTPMHEPANHQITALSLFPGKQHQMVIHMKRTIDILPPRNHATDLVVRTMHTSQPVLNAHHYPPTPPLQPKDGCARLVALISTPISKANHDEHPSNQYPKYRPFPRTMLTTRPLSTAAPATRPIKHHHERRLNHLPFNVTALFSNGPPQNWQIRPPSSTMVPCAVIQVLLL